MNPFQQAIRIQAPIDTVFALLADFQNIKRLHPLVVRVHVTRLEQPNTVRLDVKDRINMLGFIPIYTSYQSVAQVHKEEFRIRFETKASPNIRIQSEYNLRAEGEFTLVEEKASFTCPSYVERFAFQQFISSHHSMFAQLKAILEKGADAS
ncbi:SRPBCC family protein [Paenibacillus silvisoli]|uniref:SRPBCC family protein n=1 Tax=Paenibacillus silvisoli TaxID=3110539 RepID=UPI00280523F9|nr:SRPBCC family protein [Paenibacillus silvisoli]